MRIVLFCHSLRSDWNHGNAHFLRGVVRELLSRRHDVRVLEPEDGWSAANLRADAGAAALGCWQETYPELASETYDLAALDLDAALDGADLVLVHEWSEPDLVRRIGAHRRHARYRLLFHDTHHRAVTAPREMARFDLSSFDGVLAFGEVLREIYARRGWAGRVWTWHEAADTTVFRPVGGTPERDLVWIGNWGDGERTAELHEFLLDPVKRLGLAATVHGVRYPAAAQVALAEAGIEYRGWLANFRGPEIFARHRMTVHVPRRPYVEALPGIPTIRVFEALACGIPLVSAPWRDVENLFRAGTDFLAARDGAEMERHLSLLRHDAAARREIAAAGIETIRARHTCSHRVDELLAIAAGLGIAATTTKEDRACQAA
jgi:spore maturation protein CgeB